MSNSLVGKFAIVRSGLDCVFIVPVRAIDKDRIYSGDDSRGFPCRVPIADVAAFVDSFDEGDRRKAAFEQVRREYRERLRPLERETKRIGREYLDAMDAALAGEPVAEIAALPAEEPATEAA